MALKTTEESDIDAETQDAEAQNVSDEAASEQPTNDRPTQRWWKGRARTTLVAATFAALVVVAGVLGWQLWSQHTVTANGEAARQTAINYAQILTSIDSANVDRNFTDVLDGATGDFKDSYTKASVQLRQLLIDNKATAHGVVVASAIQSQTNDKVVVLLMLDQTVANAVQADSRVDRTRMKMTMEKVDGRWLASKVELP
jgi:Mce-associated membrane protein